jgi:hypothetical protein
VAASSARKLIERVKMCVRARARVQLPGGGFFGEVPSENDLKEAWQKKFPAVTRKKRPRLSA